MIFRGLLFQAMAGDNVKSAVIVSSMTFGIGHLLNLFNGSGMNLVSNLCQVCFAAAVDFQKTGNRFKFPVGKPHPYLPRITSSTTPRISSSKSASAFSSGARAVRGT